jgi:DNA-binding CsgD family transcriptional regulator
MKTLEAATTMSAFDGEINELRLRGRRGECEVLDRLLANTRAGQSQVLVLRGAEGVGKTALLEYVVRRASGCRVVMASGRESEIELAFAGLHQLCTPLLDRLECLPGPQRTALGTALGLYDGNAPAPFFLGLSVLRLLSETAKERPLVCVVDDAQRVDRASVQTLEFVARRLGNERVAIVFAVGQCRDEHDMGGLPSLVVQGLLADDARSMLESSIVGPLDDKVRDRIVVEARGKPLMLLEAARLLAAEELAGGFGLPDGLALSARLEERFRRQLEPLPAATRLLLLAAAAQPVLDSMLLRHAADRLGVGVDDAAPAAIAGLVDLDDGVRFRHPLARYAICRAAAPDERRSVQRALAEVTDPKADADRRAWYRAQATSGLDEEIASELERSVDRAKARGGLVAAAAFQERAAMLTPEQGLQAVRALTAAHTKHLAGAPEAALKLLGIAQAGPLDELGRARAGLLHAQIALGSGRGRESVPLLLEAAKRLEPLGFAVVRETHRDGFRAALAAGRQVGCEDMRKVAEAVRASDRAGASRLSLRGADRLLEGLATVATQGYIAGAPVLRQALREFRETHVHTEETLRWLPLACEVSHDLWDDEILYTLSTDLIGLARQSGAMALLPAALNFGAEIHLLVGDPGMAASMAEQAATAARATGSPLGPYGLLVLAAWSGRELEVSQVVASSTTEMLARGEGRWLTAVHWATALINNGLCRYDAALVAAEKGSEFPDEMGLATWSMVELIEAAARTGQAERATGALQRLSEATRASGTDWGLGVEARSRALLNEGELAEHLYQEAIERLGRTRIRVDLARAHLVYGEWLRRENRRVDARKQLRISLEMLKAMGIAGFAERAQRELLATGETVRKRNVETLDELTPQEVQITRLAGKGLTNSEIGTRLFISARTVEWHLRKVFLKLGVSSRREIRERTLDVDGIDHAQVAGQGKWNTPSVSPPVPTWRSLVGAVVGGERVPQDQ